MADHVRRAVSVVVCALVLLVAPQVAHAAFSGRAAPALSVGTATLTAPADVNGAAQCTSGFLSKGARFTVNGFTDAGLEDTQYTYTLFRGTTQVDTETTGSRSATLVAPNVFNLGATLTFRVVVEPRLSNWTGPTWSRTFTC